MSAWIIRMLSSLESSSASKCLPAGSFDDFTTCLSHCLFPRLRLILKSSGVIFNSLPIIAFQALPLMLLGIPFQQSLFTRDVDMFARLGFLSSIVIHSFFLFPSATSRSSSFKLGESRNSLEPKNFLALSAMLPTFLLIAVARSESEKERFPRLKSPSGDVVSEVELCRLGSRLCRGSLGGCGRGRDSLGGGGITVFFASGCMDLRS
mmetsp:Transcript_19118/g.46923  ORF Transcript_19118/g.46923 Transcript_19118/m.46923 type:complete len:207 (+) Transcript_19118:930-1550(+)